ncbi:hypothetical protein [Amycolatopsis minnesotensis]|uniref:hypothetical protein n=1 Tax=Amycolatopsis minnesotensis TaxID=337894 RepID=UPI0031D6F3AF
MLAMVCNSRRWDRRGTRRPFVWPSLLLGALAFYGSYLIGDDAFWLSFPLLVVAAIGLYGPVLRDDPRTAAEADRGGAPSRSSTRRAGSAASFLMLALTMAGGALLLLPMRKP